MAVWLPAYMAFLFHANILLIVAIHPGLGRYALPLTPLLLLFLVAVALCGCRLLLQLSTAAPPRLDSRRRRA